MSNKNWKEHNILTRNQLIFNLQWKQNTSTSDSADINLTRLHKHLVYLVGWLFNGTSTQKGQFVQTAGGGKPAHSAKDES